MNAKQQLVERYIESWNETDAEARRSAVDSVWADGARYVDPLADVTGRAEISALIGSVQEQVPGHVFRLVEGEIDAHHNVMRFSWELVPTSGGDSLAVGFDVAETGDDGRIRSVLGFLDKAPAA